MVQVFLGECRLAQAMEVWSQEEAYDLTQAMEAQSQEEV